VSQEGKFFNLNREEKKNIDIDLGGEYTKLAQYRLFFISKTIENKVGVFLLRKVI
jgi:hypothetical protein